MARLMIVGLVVTLAQKPVCKFSPCATDEQEKIMSHWRTRAKNLSDTATGPLLRYLDSKTFRDDIKGTMLEPRSSGEILQWYANNVRETSVTHSFDVKFLKEVGSMSYKANVWQFHIMNVSGSSKVQDTAETKLMGLTAFRKHMDPTWEESFNRPLYFAINIWRAADGQPFYGELTLILHPKVKDYLMISPVDTGGYTEGCINTSSSSSSSSSSWEAVEADAMALYARAKGRLTTPRCKDWDRDFGTEEHFHHLVLAHNQYYAYPLADLMRRALGKFYNDPWFYRHYYEGAFMSTMLLPDHLNYVQANFSLFGRNNIPAFALKLRRPLLWAGDPHFMIVDVHVNHINGSYVPTSADNNTFTKLWTSKPSWQQFSSAMPGALKLGQLRWGTCRMEPNSEFHGHDLEHHTGATLHQCCELCDNNRACASWNFHTNAKTCDLKSAGATLSPSKDHIAGSRGKCPVFPARNYIGVNANEVCLYWVA